MCEQVWRVLGDLTSADRWIPGVTAVTRDQIRLECDVGTWHLTIVERRPPWRNDMGAEWTRFPIARLRYTKATKRWSVYWRDRNLRFHLYDRLAPSPSFVDLLREIERDPTGIFWG